ncbi:ArsR/SmtB family transcription factor [Streptomyces sp. NPDC090442]|uniref:ArsR/SmtB family transcription factor n=1 Tax=Streptomyces sp. NPDC090442 TaxID=3365962 RepID=UPI0037F69BC0
MAELYHPERHHLQLETVLAALGDPIRLAIVRELAASGETYCSAIETGAPKSTLTRHWRVLREGGVVQRRPAGRKAYVRLRREDLEARFPGLLDTVLAADARR